jgi:hypothetical protein
MMARPDFLTSLREADARLASAMPSAAADARLRRLLARRGQRRLGLVLAPALCALVLLAVALGRDPSPLEARLAQAISTWRSTASASGSSDLPAATTVAVADLGVALRADTPSRLSRAADGLVVERGVIEFAVQPRRAGEPPVRVAVSAGVIEVLGTRFTVDQAARQGHVTLHEGKIRFRATDGREVTLRPGERLDWPLPPPTTQPPIAPASSAPVGPAPIVPAVSPRRSPPRPVVSEPTAPPMPAPRAAGTAEVLTRVAALRTRGQWADAAQALREALTMPLAPASRERLGMELVDVLVRSGASSQACEALADMAPGGRYAGTLDRLSARLGCAGEERP